MEPVSIIIPAFNEENSVATVIQRTGVILLSLEIPFEIIVVNDCSTDATAERAGEAGARVISHLKNRGYGASLKSGIRAAKFEWIVITDADGTYPVEKIPSLLEMLKNADMVTGARTGGNVHIPIIRKPGKWFLKHLAQYITGEEIPDLNSGFRAFRKSFVRRYLNILSERFSFTTTLTVASLCDGHQVSYIPIEYGKRTGKSKISPFDFFSFTMLVIRLSNLFNPLKIFVPVSLTFLGIGAFKFISDVAIAIIRNGGIGWSLVSNEIISTSSILLLMGGLQILLVGMIADGLSRRIATNMPSGYLSYSVREGETPSENRILESK